MATLPYREIFWVSAAGYVLAYFFGLQALLAHRRYSRPWMLALLALGWGAQTWAMGLRGHLAGGCPLGNVFELLQFVSWSLVLLYFLVGPAFRMSLLGFFSAGLAAMLGGGSLMVSSWDGPYRNRIFGGEPLVESHASLAVFSYGIFGLLALVGIMFFLQHWGLKHRHSKGIFSLLPSIVQMDQIAYRLLIIGLAVLTVSLGCGVVLFFVGNHSVSLMKLVVTWGIWGAYVFLLLLRWRGIYVGLPFARWSIILFCVALLSLWPVDSGNRPIRSEQQRQRVNADE